MKRSKRKTIAIAAAVLALGAGTGGAIAATSDGPGGRGGPVGGAAEYIGITADQLLEKLKAGSTLAQVATAQGKSVDGLKQALIADAKEHLASAVADGKLTAAEAKTMLDRLTANIDEIVSWTGPPLGGPMRGLHGAPGIDAATTYLGLTREELRTKIEAGSSLAQVATAQGKTVDGLKQAIIAGAKDRLDQVVADGKLTAAQAKTMLDRLTERIDDIVNRTGPPEHGPRGPMQP